MDDLGAIEELSTKKATVEGALESSAEASVKEKTRGLGLGCSLFGTESWLLAASFKGEGWDIVGRGIVLHFTSLLSFF